MKTTLQLDLHLDISSVWRIYLQNLNSSGTGFFRIPRLQDLVSSGFCANTFFRKTFVSSMFLNILRSRHLWLNTSSGTVLLCILNKHISPLTVLSSNSKTSRGWHLMHLQLFTFATRCRD